MRGGRVPGDELAMHATAEMENHGPATARPTAPAGLAG